MHTQMAQGQHAAPILGKGTEGQQCTAQLGASGTGLKVGEQQQGAPTLFLESMLHCAE